MKKTEQKILSAFLPIITFGCIIILWATSAFVVGSEYVLPSIGKTLSALILLFKDGSFYLAFFMTLLRTFISFLLSFTIAFFLAYLVKKAPIAIKCVSPLVSILRALPTVAVVLLLLYWTNSFIAPIVVTMLVVLPTLYTNLYNSLMGVDKKQVHMAKIFGKTDGEILKNIIIPQTLPSIIIAGGGALALNLKLMVAAEVLSATSNSLGGQLSYFNYNLEIASMIALVVVTVIFSILVELVFSLISKRAGKFL